MPKLSLGSYATSAPVIERVDPAYLFRDRPTSLTIKGKYFGLYAADLFRIQIVQADSNSSQQISVDCEDVQWVDSEMVIN